MKGKERGGSQRERFKHGYESLSMVSHIWRRRLQEQNGGRETKGKGRSRITTHSHTSLSTITRTHTQKGTYFAGGHGHLIKGHRHTDTPQALTRQISGPKQSNVKYAQHKIDPETSAHTHPPIRTIPQLRRKNTIKKEKKKIEWRWHY